MAAGATSQWRNGKVKMYVERRYNIIIIILIKKNYVSMYINGHSVGYIMSCVFNRYYTPELFLLNGVYPTPKGKVFV